MLIHVSLSRGPPLLSFLFTQHLIAMTTLDQVKSFLIDYYTIDQKLNQQIQFDLEAINILEKEWEAFEEFANNIGFDPDEHRVLMCHPDRSILSYVIEDWVYTRNGDGAGFWDGDWQSHYAMKLTKFCKEQGPIQLYLDEDENMLYTYSSSK